MSKPPFRVGDFARYLTNTDVRRIEAVTRNGGVWLVDWGQHKGMDARRLVQASGADWTPHVGDWVVLDEIDETAWAEHAAYRGRCVQLVEASRGRDGPFYAKWKGLYEGAPTLLWTLASCMRPASAAEIHAAQGYSDCEREWAGA